jgi:hypothetical protein
MTVESCPTTGFHETRPWVYETEHGMYVKHADYAALQAENERLRKAGDAMENRLYEISGNFDLEPFDECGEWNKAKAKGVQP